MQGTSCVNTVYTSSYLMNVEIEYRTVSRTVHWHALCTKQPVSDNTFNRYNLVQPAIKSEVGQKTKLTRKAAKISNKTQVSCSDSFIQLMTHSILSGAKLPTSRNNYLHLCTVLVSVKKKLVPENTGRKQLQGTLTRNRRWFCAPKSE